MQGERGRNEVTNLGADVRVMKIAIYIYIYSNE
jgi:hypothetical protein